MNVFPSVKLPPWHLYLSLLILWGIFLRVGHFDQPVYWVDEVATSIRVAGHTRSELIQSLAPGQIISVADALSWQQLSRDRPWSDTLNALIHSPEHAPLYFLIARGWAEIFGSSVTAMRSLSVVFSLLTFPAMMVLGRILLSAQVGVLATALFAVSPFFIAYAQEARPYSLWILTLVLMSGCLWRSLTRPSGKMWSLYVLAVILSLYTSLLTSLVLLGQGLFVVFMHRNEWRSYLLATGLAMLVFLPWIGVIITHWQTLQHNTIWMQDPIPLWAMLGIWLYNLAVLFFDVPVSLDVSLSTIAKIFISLGILGLMLKALNTLINKAPKPVGLFIIAGAVSTPLSLIGFDWLMGHQTSTAARYFVPFYLGILFAIAYQLILGMAAQPPCWAKRWRQITVGILSLCLLSGILQWSHSPKYQKSRNLSNPAIAALVNSAPNPLLIADPEQFLDILSLSHQLHPSVSLAISQTPDRSLVTTYCHAIFVLNPSPTIQATLTSVGTLQSLYQPPRLIPSELTLSLWQFQPYLSTCPNAR